METTKEQELEHIPTIKERGSTVYTTQQKGKYPSIEAASIAKMESAKDFIANIDMTLFKKNGPVE